MDQLSILFSEFHGGLTIGGPCWLGRAPTPGQLILGDSKARLHIPLMRARQPESSPSLLLT